MPIRVREMMAPELGVAAAALGWCLAFRALGLPPGALPIGLGVLMLVAWRAGASRAETRAGALLDKSCEALDTARRQLAAAEDRLHGSRKMEAIGRLAAGIAHDFNNQLTVISSNVEILQRSLDATDSRLARRAAAAMQGVQRAAALSNRVLTLSRAPQPPEPEAVDVGRVLEGLLSLLRRGFGDRAALRLRLPQEPWLVWADMSRIETVLLALAVEACDRVPAGGTVTLAAEAVRLDAGRPGLLPGEYVGIEVTAPDAGQRAGGGACAMAIDLARATGGAWLTSDDPASCRLLLPRHAPAPLAEAVAPRVNRPGRRATILVVEDDAAVRAACVEVLRGLDYDVLEAPDAMEGFRLIADGGGIDLLFTDIGLPGGVSGRALADAVRQVDGAVQVVFTTGYAAAAGPHRPGTALLPKPFAPAQLAAAVRDALGARLPAAS